MEIDRWLGGGRTRMKTDRMKTKERQRTKVKCERERKKN